MVWPLGFGDRMSCRARLSGLGLLDWSRLGGRSWLCCRIWTRRSRSRSRSWCRSWCSSWCWRGGWLGWFGEFKWFSKLWSACWLGWVVRLGSFHGLCLSRLSCNLSRLFRESSLNVPNRQGDLGSSFSSGSCLRNFSRRSSTIFRLFSSSSSSSRFWMLSYLGDVLCWGTLDNGCHLELWWWCRETSCRRSGSLLSSECAGRRKARSSL